MTETLLSKRLTLVPNDDLEYFLDLAEKDNKRSCTRTEVKEFIEKYGQEFWQIMLGGTRRGIVGYFKVNGVIILEALKDHDAEPTGIGYSVEVGRLMLDYLFKITDRVRTVARVDDLAIQILCKKLGFEQIDIKDGLIIYEKGQLRCQ